ncbi:ThuA domain-containing protein [Chondrinema litorale]|uniref:ThuA domain-containing protein n=1 Tax=Chondrinema litorale TaxID=2994555 RepID=UPI002543755B|nr:ThuA domain-containing protein [Chondrinema litorale]UZR95379.1 ThuA domain-containing protein [Chondrinema litorale]
MKINHLHFVLAFCILGLFSCSEKEKRLLIFSKTAEFRHNSIEAGQAFFFKYGKENGYQIDTTENSELFNEENLKKYSAVVFLNTTGDVLNHAQQADFERYIQAGGGYIGIHAASDTEYEWPWYGKLMGGWFDGHPGNPNVRTGKVTVLDKNHPSTKNLPDSWDKADEFYNYKSLNMDMNFLITVDEKSYGAGKHGDFHPITWYHDFDGGRAFFTGFGHTPETFSEKEFVELMKGGIEYAVGDNKLDYTVAHSERKPEENRFVKKVFTTNLEEPMELEVLPNGKILFIERKGAVKLYDPKTEALKVISHLDVFKDLEDGLLGFAIDPNFEENNRLFFYYSPPGEKPIQRLSRFTMLGDSLILDSEKVILEIPTQREACCHSGGSIEFGPNGNLFIALGDNTSPFNSEQKFDTDGFGPMDERAGRSNWDAQKSSASPNDLRGKILRIKPEEDGTYSIPDGNLFPKDGSGGKPEIFVMGCRNPYRISIDPKTGWLYWGDVGPDAGEDNENRGPKGHDEFNQAKKAGFYGWPYFVGNNKPYRKMNYVTGEVSDFFDPEHPVNTSPNNTGVQNLPPAQSAMVWYSYGESTEFPDMASGGRNAMAGPVYYYDDYEGDKNRFPKYYDKKVFHYDWIRGWIHAITLDEEGNYLYQEPFLPSMEFNNMIDIKLHDGSFYFLEYGKNWYSKNEDARLGLIDYAASNRTPIAKVSADKLVGAAPLTVNFSAEKSFDYDQKDELTYEWFFTSDDAQGNGITKAFTFDKPGIYQAKVKVSDKERDASFANIEIQVGNERPVISVNLNGNSSFYWNNSSLDYQIKVEDLEDGDVDAQKVKVFYDYMPIGNDEIEVELGHKQTGAVVDASVLLKENLCLSCHDMKNTSIGPTYTEVAAKYDSDQATIDKLVQKVIKGGSGVWGDRMMAANPSLSKIDAETMVRYIVSLDEEQVKPSLPTNGTIAANKHLNESNGYYILTAEYTDKGGEIVGPLSAKETIKLRSAKLQAEDFDGYKNLSKRTPGGSDLVHLNDIRKNSYFMFEDIDLTGISQLTVKTGCTQKGFVLNVRKGSVEGEIIATGNIPYTNGEIEGWSEVPIPVTQPVDSNVDLYFTFDFTGEEEKGFITLDWIYFNQPVTLGKK